MEERIDTLIKSLLDKINGSDISEMLAMADVISKLVAAKQTLFCIGEIKNQKAT